VDEDELQLELQLAMITLRPERGLLDKSIVWMKENVALVRSPSSSAARSLKVFGLPVRAISNAEHGRKRVKEGSLTC